MSKFVFLDYFINNSSLLYVRKKQRTQNTVSDDEKIGLKKRATFTSVFLCIVFSYLYVIQVFN